MAATPGKIRHVTLTPIDEADVKAVHEHLDAIAYGARDDAAALQALELFLHDVRVALANSQGPKRRVVMRAVARYQRQTLRIEDPEAAK